MRPVSGCRRGLSRWALRAAVSLVALVGAGPAGAEILYDQYDNPGPFASSSQNYETSQNAFDTELADDFVVAASNGWLVNQIEIDGQYFNGPGPASSFNVRFYADAGGLPGSEIAARTNVSFTPGPECGRRRDRADARNPARRGDLLALGAGESELHPRRSVGLDGSNRPVEPGRCLAKPGQRARDRLHVVGQARDDLQRRLRCSGPGLSTLREHRRRRAAARARPDDDHRRGRRRPPRAGRDLRPRRANP